MKKNIRIFVWLFLIFVILFLVVFIQQKILPEKDGTESKSDNNVVIQTNNKKQRYLLTDDEQKELLSHGYNPDEMKNSEIVVKLYGDDKYTKYENMTKYNDNGYPEYDLSEVETLYTKYFSLYKFGNYADIISDFNKLKEEFSFTNLLEHKLLSLIDDANFALNIEKGDYSEMLRFMNNHKNPETLLWDFHLINPKIMREIIFDDTSIIPIYKDIEIIDIEEIWASDDEELFETKRGYETGSRYIYEITYRTNKDEVFVSKVGVLSNGSCFIIDNFPINGNVEDYVSIRFYTEPY